MAPTTLVECLPKLSTSKANSKGKDVLTTIRENLENPAILEALEKIKDEMKLAVKKNQSLSSTTNSAGRKACTCDDVVRCYGAGSID